MEKQVQTERRNPATYITIYTITLWDRALECKIDAEKVSEGVCEVTLLVASKENRSGKKIGGNGTHTHTLHDRCKGNVFLEYTN